MKKAALLLLLLIGCSSDDDPLLPDPAPAPPPAPGELPTEIVVTELNLQDEVCPDVPSSNRSGVLTHMWTNITVFDVSANELKVTGDLITMWDNTDCHSEKLFVNATQTYPTGPTAGDVIIVVTPTYFQSQIDEG